jgi:hypothetical protein
MIKIHELSEGSVAELLPVSEKINEVQDILDIMADAGYNGCKGIIIHEKTLHRDFFDLKTKLAGDILQKFSNYRMKLAIVGDFSDVKSKSLRDFIRESNKLGIIRFVADTDTALRGF